MRNAGGIGNSADLMHKLVLPRQAHLGQVHGVQHHVADEKNPIKCGNLCRREGGRRKSVSDETQPSRDSTVQALAQLTLTLTCPSSCRQRDAPGDRARPYDCLRAALSSKPPHPASVPATCSLLLAALAEHDDVDRNEARAKTRVSLSAGPNTVSDFE